MEFTIKSPYNVNAKIKYAIKDWPSWEYKPFNFLWNYNEKEIDLIIEGKANIKTYKGYSHLIKLGNLV